MRTSNTQISGAKAASATRGATNTTRAGSPGIRFISTSSGLDVIAATVYVDGALVTDAEDDDAVFITIGTTGVLTPEATISITKDPGNPTFNFNALVENVIKVGSTYYCPYIRAAQDKIYLATASDRDGPWTEAGEIYALTSVAWRPGGTTVIYAPHIILDGSTFYLFYSICNGTTGANGYIGYATASAVTGTYTDHGAAVLSPGAGAAWDSLRVGEPAVYIHGGTWYMAYMGETTAAAFGASEKLGIATASAPSGAWTKAAGNPIAWGASGEFDDALMADPDIFYYAGYWWIWYVGSVTTGPPVPAEEGFLYTTDPTDVSSWTRHPSNPILTVGGSGAWDDELVFRGGIWIEDGELGGVYTGSSDASALTNCKGGNFRLTLTGVQEDPDADQIAIDDTGGYFTGDEVEAALQEIGATLALINAGGVGHYEVLVDGAPPEPVLTPDDLDWVYGFVLD